MARGRGPKDFHVWTKERQIEYCSRPNADYSKYPNHPCNNLNSTPAKSKIQNPWEVKKPIVPDSHWDRIAKGLLEEFEEKQIFASEIDTSQDNHEEQLIEAVQNDTGKIVSNVEYREFDGGSGYYLEAFMIDFEDGTEFTNWDSTLKEVLENGSEDLYEKVSGRKDVPTEVVEAILSSKDTFQTTGNLNTLRTILDNLEENAKDKEVVKWEIGAVKDWITESENMDYASQLVSAALSDFENEDIKMSNFDSKYEYMSHLSNYITTYYQGNFTQSELDFVGDSFREELVNQGYCSDQDWEDYFNGKLT